MAVSKSACNRWLVRHMEKRRALKDRLYTLCKDIFVGDAEYSRCLRFPEQYKKLLQTVQHLEFMFPDMPPIYHAWDTKVITRLLATFFTHL